MPFSSLFEAEKYINGLDEDTKQRLITTTSFMLINNINQQNNLDTFSLIQKMASLLSSDNQKQLLAEVNSVVMKHLFKNNVDIFPIIHKLSTLLSEDNKQKVVTDLDFIIENTVFNKISVSETQPGNITSFQEEMIKPITSNDNNIPNSAPFGIHTVARHIQQTQNRNHTPSPLPSSIVNKTPLPKITSGINLTGTFNLKPKDSTDSPSRKNSLPIKETIKYIIPFQTELGRKALTDFSTPTTVYQFLKEVNGQTTAEKIYSDLYSGLDYPNFISKIYDVFTPKYITLKKAANLPSDKDIRLRIGEWLVMLGYLEENKLEKIVQLHSVAVKNNEVNNRRFAVKTIVNNQPVEHKGPFFGAFLIESEVITKEQLSQALMFQNQYNEIIAGLK